MNREAVRSTASPFEGLLFSVFQSPRESRQKGLVIALTSSLPGEGVSYLVGQLTQLLSDQSSGSVLVVDLSKLSSLETIVPVGTGPTGAKVLLPSAGFSSADWHASWQYRRDLIAGWRTQFEYVLIDCPSNSASGEAIAIAQHVDGIVLVVEANRTTRQQLERTEHQLETAGGKTLGYILNKRRYIVPNWLFRYL